MATTSPTKPTTSPTKPGRENREFRIMFRPTGTTVGHGGKDVVTKKNIVRRKVSRLFGHGPSSVSFLDELSTFLAGKASHWALVILAPTLQPILNPDNPRRSRPPIKADDPRIQRVFELRRKSGSSCEIPVDSGEDRLDPPGLTRLDDSDQEDRHSDDEGFSKGNKAGSGLEMRVSEKPRPDFQELKYEHLGGVCWEILTGIEARTKFTNSELRHEAERIWKRQQNYHLLTNNCQNFCVLLAITIRAKNHSLLRILHGQTVKRQIKDVKAEDLKDQSLKKMNGKL